MKTVIDKTTGQVLKSFFGEVEITENEILVEAEATGNFYNIETKEFFNWKCKIFLTLRYTINN